MAKIVNYTADQTSAMVAVYTAAVSDSERAVVVADMSELLGKTKRSVIAKLVAEKVYVPKVATKTPSTNKVDLVARMATIAELFTDEIRFSDAERASMPLC